MIREKNERPKISVITVTYNAEKLLDKTIESVYRQTYNNYEYIFIDGKSEDNTCQIIEKYIRMLNNKGVKTFYLSEKDNGIYDAMNKGSTYANGDWINFLNAGDSLADENVFARISEYLDTEHSVIYGGTNYIGSDGRLLRTGKGAEPNVMPKHMPFCVQAAFVKTDLQNKYKYSVKYKISADYDFFLRLYKDGYQYKRADVIVNNYLMGGFSSQNPFETYVEVGKIREANGYLNRKSPIYLCKLVRFWIVCKFRKRK